MKTIIIESKDDKTWERFGNYEWENHTKAENDINKINQEIHRFKKWDSHQFEFVGKDYFEKYKQPHL